jgi:hypothetical protein
MTRERKNTPAHDSLGDSEAHDSTPPPGSYKPVQINVDHTGISMSAKTAYKVIMGVITLTLVLAGGWYGLLLNSVSQADFEDHNIDTRETAHPITLEGESGERGLVQVVRDHETKLKELEKTSDAVASVRDGFFEYRAEQLADQVADKIDNPRRSREVWKQVRTRALSNQEHKKPIREGLEYLVAREL